MVGIVKKVNREGSGIIAIANGEKVPSESADPQTGRKSCFFPPHGQGQGVRPEHYGNAR